MPRNSFKKKVLVELGGLWVQRMTRQVVGMVESDSSMSNSTVDNILDTVVEAAYNSLQQRRYVYRGVHRHGIRDYNIFDRDLSEQVIDDIPPWLSDIEFLEKYRCHRSNFWSLFDLIKDHPIFGNQSQKKKQVSILISFHSFYLSFIYLNISFFQTPPQYQLMVYLFYIGMAGSGASNPKVRNMFGIGRGTSHKFRERCIVAIRSLKGETVFWPDENERQEIALRMYNNFQWPNCLAVADGTLFPLKTEPQSQDGPDYSGRKFGYSLTVMIVNDDQKRIRHYLAGHPGSVHDNRVYKATKLALEADLHFGTKYYLLGDSAFENSPTVVSAFKNPRGHAMTDDQRRFNTHLGRLRVTSEHTIGILKGRFAWLQNIPMIITDDPRSVAKILKCIDCCIILHNILVNCNDEIPEEWWVELDDASDIASAIGNPELADIIPLDAPKDTRRSKLLAFLKDYVF
jgi:hypothetical protein